VLVVAIHNEAVNTYQGVIDKLGLQTSFFEIELFSSIRAVVEQGVQAHMILDMGARTTKLYIVERGLLRTSHVINRGSQDITLAISKAMSLTPDESENLKRIYGLEGGMEHKDIAEIISLTLDYVFYEANRVLLNFQRQYNKNVTSVILTGGGVLLRGFAELAKASFQTDVVYADPFSKLETPAVLAQQLRVAGPEFAVAIGVALRRLNELA
jgi:type IV pilus assembly protein PilM